MISVVIFTYNEENNIAECIQSARLLSDSLLVVDTSSTDQTVAIARSAGVDVLVIPPTEYVEPARLRGIQAATGEWVFILDADERITEELATEIKKTVPQTDHSFFRIKRKNIFARKQWLRHGGWWPDEQIRLLKKSAFQTWPEKIHSTPVIEGSYGVLHEPLLHYFHGNIASMVQKTILYENIESELLFHAHRPATTKIFFRKFFGELNRRLIKNQGYRDGTVGVMEAVYQAFSKTITYLFLYEKNKNRSV